MQYRVCDKKPVKTPRELSVALLTEALDTCEYGEFYPLDLTSHHIEMAKKIESFINAYWSAGNYRTMNSTEPRRKFDHRDSFNISFNQNNKYVKGYVDRVVLVSLALSQRCYTGFYSILFNSRIRSLKSHFVKNISNLPVESIFPEVLSNKFLTAEESQTVKEQFALEYKTLRECYITKLDKMQSRGYITCPNFFRHFGDVEMSDQDSFDYYSKCYGKICFQSKKSLGKTFSSPIPTQMFVDSDEKKNKQFYCVSLLKLLWELQSDNPMNPITRNRLGDETTNILKTQYPLESKLIKYSKYIVSQS